MTNKKLPPRMVVPKAEYLAWQETMKAVEQERNILRHTLAALVLLNGGKVTLSRADIDRASGKVLGQQVMEGGVVWTVKGKEVQDEPAHIS